MYAADVYVGQLVKYKKWAELARTWLADRDGDLRIVNSEGRLIDFMFKSEKSRCGNEYVVSEIMENYKKVSGDRDEEGCFVKLTPNEFKFHQSWIHCYKLDPVEQENVSFNEGEFLSMLGVNDG